MGINRVVRLGRLRMPEGWCIIQKTMAFRSANAGVDTAAEWTVRRWYRRGHQKYGVHRRLPLARCGAGCEIQVKLQWHIVIETIALGWSGQSYSLKNSTLAQRSKAGNIVAG